MSVVAKFKCTSINRVSGGEIVTLAAVYGPDNETWAKHTPYGELKMQINNPDARGRFEVDREYMLTIAPAPSPEG